ncbi:MAG: hypothetical protein AAGI37_08465 [Planctomycetota bacterium]
MTALLTLAVACSEQSVNSPADVGYQDWAAVETAIIDSLPEVFESDESIGDRVFDLSAMRRIRDGGSLDLWLEMCEQTDYSLVALAGYLCIEANEPDHRMEAALTIFSHHPMASLLGIYDEPFVFIGEKAEATAKNIDALDSFLSDSQISDHRKAEVFVFIRQAMKTAWLLAADVSHAPTEVQAIAVDHAVIEWEAQREPIPKKVELLLLDFAQMRDVRQSVWLKNFPIDAEIEDRREAILSVLRNDELEDRSYSFALRPHVVFIDEQIDMEKVDLSPVQRARIDRFMSQSR